MRRTLGGIAPVIVASVLGLVAGGIFLGSGGGTPSAEAATVKPVPRFEISRPTAGSTPADVFLLDFTTGDTWVYDAATVKWLPVVR